MYHDLASYECKLKQCQTLVSVCSKSILCKCLHNSASAEGLAQQCFIKHVFLGQYYHTIGDVASSEVIRILEPFKIVDVPKVLSEDRRKSIKFAKKNIPHYNPRAGYAYYEFTKCGYVLPERNVMARKKVN